MDIRNMLAGVNIDKMVQQGSTFVKSNLPRILAFSAIGCYGMALYETAKATHKSDMDIAEEEERRASTVPLYENVKLTTKEKVELCWKNYVKALLYGGAGTFFVLASERKGNEKYLALMSAYELSKKAGEERKEAEVDILGEDKAREIEQAVHQRMAKNVTVPADGIQDVATGNGEKTLYIEPMTNTPFYATYEDVLHAFNYVNHKRVKHGIASINDLLHALGLREMEIATDWGWNENQDYLEPVFDNPTYVNDDHTMPAAVIGYSIEPQFDYGNDKNDWRC